MVTKSTKVVGGAVATTLLGTEAIREGYSTSVDLDADKVADTKLRTATADLEAHPKDQNLQAAHDAANTAAQHTGQTVVYDTIGVIATTALTTIAGLYTAFQAMGRNRNSPGQTAAKDQLRAAKTHEAMLSQKSDTRAVDPELRQMIAAEVAKPSKNASATRGSKPQYDPSDKMTMMSGNGTHMTGMNHPELAQRGKAATAASDKMQVKTAGPAVGN